MFTQAPECNGAGCFRDPALDKIRFGEMLMIDQNRELQNVGSFGGWVRRGDAISVASAVAILACVAVFMVTGSTGAAAGSVVCLILVLADMPSNARRIKVARRAKEAMDRYAARPLGL